MVTWLMTRNLSDFKTGTVIYRALKDVGKAKITILVLTIINKTLVIMKINKNSGFIFMHASNQDTFVSDFSAINQRIGQCSSSIKADKRQNGERPAQCQCGEHVS